MLDRATGTSLAAVPAIALAIGAFGIVYGTLAAPILGAPLALASSILIFSGAAQFTLVGLLATGATSMAVLWAIVVLNLRNLALGAMVRPRLAREPAARRAGLAWFLIDETVGLALVDRATAARTLLRAGIACYLAFVAGTAIGLAGAGVPHLEPLAAAVFPVLFVGLTAMAVTDRQQGVRALASAAIVTVALLALPALGGLAPVVVGVVVASVGRRS